MRGLADIRGRTAQNDVKSVADAPVLLVCHVEHSLLDLVVDLFRLQLSGLSTQMRFSEPTADAEETKQEQRHKCRNSRSGIEAA